MIRLSTLLVENAINSDFISMIKNWENSIKSGWNPTKKRWYPHNSPEGGNPTIAYGHKITDNEVRTGKFQNGITEQQATRQLTADLQIAVDKAIMLIPKYASLPKNIQQALVNACYRGELKRTYDTVKLMNANNWKSASIEYLNRDDYQSGGSGIQQRMNWNAKQFASYVTPGKIKTKSSSNFFSNWFDTQKKAMIGNVYAVKTGDTLSAIAAKHKTTVDSLKRINQLKTDTIQIGQKLKLK